jgi:hypothetical protein
MQRAYKHDHHVTFPNRIAVQALASVEMSRVVQQDLEEMSRNAQLEHERQGQLLALGRAGVPHHVAGHVPAPTDPPPEWGVRKGLSAIGRGGAAIGRGVVSMLVSGDASTTYGASSKASGAPPSVVAPSPSVDHDAPIREGVEQLKAAVGELQKIAVEKQKRKAIAQEARENEMDVDEENVQFILNLFQQNFTVATRARNF